MTTSSRGFSKRGRLFAAFLTPAALLGAWSVAATQEKPAMKPETAEKKFKNIKVLKKLPAEELIPVMRKFNASLGVKCDFCHVIGPDHSGFEKDDKPTKEVARKMILMTDSINAHQPAIRKQATCFMCHHGSPEPETKAP